MSKFVFYDAETDEIKKIVECNMEDARSNLEEGEDVLMVPLDTDVGDDTHFVEHSSRSLKPKTVLAGDKDLTMTVGERKVFSLPEPCLVFITGGAEHDLDVDDGVLALEFSTPGVYHFDFQMIHYVKEQVTVHVQED